MLDKAPAHGIYFEKLQTGLLYWAAGRSIDMFSATMGALLNSFAEQDKVHATYLHGMLVELDEIDPSSTPITVEIHRIKGIGEKNPEDGEKERIGEVVENWLVSLISHEKVIIAALAEILKNNSDLVDFAKKHIDFQGLINISEDRISVMSEIISMTRNGLIFKRDAENSRWKCRQCGHVIQNSEAPETCLCCEAEQSFMEAGDWRFP